MLTGLSSGSTGPPKGATWLQPSQNRASGEVGSRGHAMEKGRGGHRVCGTSLSITIYQLCDHPLLCLRICLLGSSQQPSLASA